MARRSMAISSRLACMKSTSSGQWLAQCLGHGLGPTVGHQPPTDLGLDLLAELLDPGLVLVALQALLERGHVLVLTLLGLVHQPFQDPVEVEVPQRPVQVVGTADRPAGLHPGDSA